MSNALAIVKVENVNDLEKVSDLFYKSGLFPDLKTSAQIAVKIMAGSEIGILPFASISGIHVISGKPVLGAGLIASIIKRSGKYDYRVKETTETICTIEFFQGTEHIGTSSFTIEQAKKADVKNLAKFSQNMLFARAISNGAKWFTPDVFGGPIYTEGEITEERAPYQREATQRVEETTAEVVQEAKVVAQPTYTKEQQALNSQAFLEWQNGIDTLPNLADAYTNHVATLRGLKGIKAEEKVDLFTKFKGIAWDKGFDYNDETKSFYAAEPVAQTEEAV